MHSQYEDEIIDVVPLIVWIVLKIFMVLIYEVERSANILLSDVSGNNYAIEERMMQFWMKSF
jgi:hypothetical protein